MTTAVKYALVPALYERESDAAPGAFYVVKDQCIICAWPIEAAPANITWSAETFQRPNSCESCPKHCRVERQPQTPDELTLVIEAAVGSCVQAIRYCGTDPEIIARFRFRGLEKLCDALRQ